ncbi:alpha/beta fold hydrolase [Corynebacterium terpenotabidum]|uniref:Serine aminopeptidase S33 domain-containing protein n=1 Tax=Corynebacterium terpenotabidum Y-11 TaxID=1200352 RepID=S4XB25_9CORY|nr:hypothetical protein A606_00030 [Corynebacterium terpenotabidum Y-11]
MCGSLTSEALVTMPDGSASRVLLFAPDDADIARPLIVIWPGFGVGARYYRPIAQELASRGFPVAVGELRGQGSSTAVASWSDRWGYHDMASQDYPRTIRAAKARFDLPSDYPTVLLTHSMGGQIGSIFLSRPETADLGVIGMMGVGSGSPFTRAFPNPERRRLRIGGILMGGVSAVLGYWPGGRFDVTPYGRQSGVHLREWARFGRTNSLARLRGQDIDYTAAMQELELPVLFTRFSNDEYCTVASSRALANLIPKAFARVEELPGTLGHNTWAREPQEISDRFELFVAEISPAVS